MALVGLVLVSDVHDNGKPLFVNPDEVAVVVESGPRLLTSGESIATSEVYVCTRGSFRVFGNARDVAAKIAKGS